MTGNFLWGCFKIDNRTLATIQPIAINEETIPTIVSLLFVLAKRSGVHIPSKEIAPINSKMQYITKSIKIGRLPAIKSRPSFNPFHISEIDVWLPEEISSGISTTNSNTKKANRKVLKSIIKIHCKPNVLRMVVARTGWNIPTNAPIVDWIPPILA